MHPAALLYLPGRGQPYIEWSTSRAPIEVVGENIPSDFKSRIEWMGQFFTRNRISVADSIEQSGYHQATVDHPFLDMAQGEESKVRDARRMAGYLKQDPYPPVFLDLDHDLILQLERAEDLGIDELRNSSLCRLSAIISGSFGLRRHQAAYFDPVTGYHQVELLGKSVPSGGSRHPTELFVDVHRAPKLQKGLWHFATRTNQLVRVSDSPISEMPESTADWVLGIHLVSAVARAMFRYRDPRSFRAVLVDAGHADAQLEALARFCNWRYRSDLYIGFDLSQKFQQHEATLPQLIRGTLEGWDA